MPGTPLAEAFVRVRALTNDVKPDIERGLKGIGDQFGKQFAAEASARLRDERGRFTSAGRDAGAEFGRGLAEEGAVQFGHDGNAFVAVGRQVGDEAGAAAGQAFGKRYTQDARGRWHDERGRFVSEAEALGDAAGEAFGKGFNKGGGRGSGRKTGKDFSDGFADGLGDLGRKAFDLLLPSLGRLTVGLGEVGRASLSALASLGKWTAIGTGIAALGAAAASASGYVVALAADLIPLGGLAAALPGVLLTGAAALVTWKLAMLGVVDALKKAGPGHEIDFQFALDKLSVSARATVLELRDTAVALKDLQQSIQESFFQQLVGSFTNALDAVRQLTPALNSLSSELGVLVRKFVEVVTSQSGIAQLNTVLLNTAGLIAGIRMAVTPLLSGFLELAAVGSTWLASMSGGLTSVLTRFGEWMSRVASSGEAWQWMDGALAVLKQLGTLAKDLWGIFAGLFAAARQAGGGALGVLGQLVSLFNTWVNSTQGFDTLVILFQALNDVGKALLPVITALGSAVAAIAPEAAKVATALGPVLASAIKALGPAIAAIGPGVVALIGGLGQAVKAIGPALLPLGQAISGAFVTLKPLIAALGPAIAALLPGVQAFLGALSSGLAAVKPVLEPLGRELGKALGALGGALGMIIPQIAKIALALAPALTAAIRGLGPALAALGPGLTAVATYLAKAFADPAMQNGLLALGKGISDVLIAAAPLLPIIGQLAGILAQVLGAALTNIGSALGPIISALASALKPALTAVSDALTQMLPLMQPIYKAFGDIGAALITQLLPPFINLIPVMINSLIPAFVEFARQIQPLIPLLADLAIKFVNEILPSILPILPQLTELSLAFARLGITLSQLVVDMKPYIDAIIAVFQFLYDTLVGHSIIPDLINGMTKWFRDGVQWIKDAVAWFGQLPQMIGEWMGSVLARVSDAWNSIRTTVADRIGSIRQVISDMLGQIGQRWNDAWDNARTFVSNAWENIKNAVSQKAVELIVLVAALPNRIVSALGNLGGLLYNSGRAILQGLIDGLWSMFNTVWNTANDILNRIRSLFPFSPAKEGPFSGKGWTLYSGQAIGQAFAGGMAQQGGPVAEAARALVGGAAAVFNESLALPSVAGPSSADVAGGLSTPVLSGRVLEPTAGGMTVQSLNLTVQVQGILDPSNPSSYRRMVQQLREEIRGLEREAYAT